MSLTTLLPALLSVTAQSLIWANLTWANTAQAILKVVRKAHLLANRETRLLRFSLRRVRIDSILNRPFSVHTEGPPVCGGMCVMLRTSHGLLQTLKTNHLISWLVMGRRHCKRFKIRITLSDCLVLAPRLQLRHQSFDGHNPGRILVLLSIVVGLWRSPAAFLGDRSMRHIHIS